MSGDPSGTNGDTSPRQSGRWASPTLIGRDRELGRLASAVSTAPAFAVVAGTAGVGKTRLLSELRTRPEVAKHRFLVAACRPIREPVPLGPIVDALRDLGDALDATELSPASGALRPMLPELGRLLPPQPEPLVDRGAERRRRFRGFVDLLGALGPTVLAIEDAHWLDEQTIDFMASLLVEPPEELTVILTVRAAEVPPTVRALTAALPESVGHTHLALDPLDAAETGAMAAAVLDIEQVSEEFAAHLCERASGLPFAIQELLALLEARGTLGHRDPGLTRKALTGLNLPSGVRELMVERADHLTDRGRAVLDAAATVQLPASLSTLVGTCRASDHDALRGVDEALESGLLVEHRATFALCHVLATEAVHEAIPLPRRQDLHRRAAASLEQLRPIPRGQLAHHRRESGEIDAWAEAAELAADRAVAAGDESEAARLLDELLRAAAPLGPQHRARLAVKLGRIALDAARPAQLIAPLSDAVDRASDLSRGIRGKLRFWLGLLLRRAGQDPARQRRLFAEAIDELDDQPELKASAMIQLASGSPSVVSEQLAWVRKAREILPEVKDPAYDVFLRSKVGSVLVMAGDPHWRDAADRIREATGGRPRRRHEVRAYSAIAGCAGWAGHHEFADDWLARALATEEALDDERLAFRLRSNAAVLDYCRGRWDGLRERVERLTERPRVRVDLDVIASRLALAEGDLDAAAGRVDDLMPVVRRLDAFELLPMTVETRIRLALARDDATTAMAAADDLRDAVRSGGIWLPTTRAIPAVVDAMAASGRADEAGTWLTQLGQELHDLDAPLAPAALEHAHGLLAAAEGRWDAAVGHLRTAAKRYDALGCRYESAQAREQAAHAQLVVEPPAAERLLRAAATTYHDLGARWDLDRVTETARLHGMSLSVRQPGGRPGRGPGLSPREREVAVLAAAGHTNREIADKLSVSISTAKKHLSAAMRKLGVRSRAALPRGLDAARS